MRTVMSAYSQEALAYDEGRTFIYSRVTDQCRDVSSGQARQWLHSHGELRSLDVSHMGELRQSLGHYADCRSALRLALYSIDSSLSRRVREMALEELHPLVAQNAVRHWLEDLFFVQPLPDESIKDVRETIEFAKVNEFGIVADFFEPILQCQREIVDLAAIWSEIERSNFLGESHTEILEHALGTGLFKKIACERRVVNTKQLAQAVPLYVKVPLDPETRGRVGGRVPINCKEMGDLIGFSETLEGIEHFNFWDNALAGSNVFVIGRGDATHIHKGSLAVRRQELVVKIEGRTEQAAVPTGLYEVATSLYAKELERPGQRFEFDPPPGMMLSAPAVKQSCDKLKKWGSSLGKGICSTIRSAGSIRLVK